MERGDAAQDETQWEQVSRIDVKRGYLVQRKTLQVMPVVLLLLAVHYAEHDEFHFWLNLAHLGFEIIPKMPDVHGVRILGFNR